MFTTLFIIDLDPISFAINRLKSTTITDDSFLFKMIHEKLLFARFYNTDGFKCACKMLTLKDDNSEIEIHGTKVLIEATPIEHLRPCGVC